MNTNDKLLNYLNSHSEIKPTVDQYLCSESTLLAKISTATLPLNVLTLIDNFLKSLSFEEASIYVNSSNNYYDCKEDGYLNNYHNHDRGEPLILICEDVNLMKIIIKYVNNINVVDDYGYNKLSRVWLSTDEPNFEMIQLLLDHKIDVNAINLNDRTLLMDCCEEYDGGKLALANENKDTMIELLMFNGADPLIKSSTNMMAYDYVNNKRQLSERLKALLQGMIKMNNTKRAR